MAGAGDPGDEDVVGVIDEVVASQGVDELVLAVQVRGRDGHELAIARRGHEGSGPGEQIALLGDREEGSGDEDHRVVARTRPVDDHGDRCSVTDSELMEKIL
jgi:hypothetical protein